VSDAGGGQLRREIGTPALAANVVNMIVGSGIFVLPATAAAALGPAALLAYLCCAGIVALVGLCFAECGSRVADSGGPVAYIEAAFGPYPGAVAGSLAYLSFLAASPAVANVLLGTLAGVVPALAHGPARVAAFVALYATFATANLRGVRTGARTVAVMTAIKITPLVLLAAAGLLAIQSHNFAGFVVPSVGRLAETTLVVVFAFVGVEGALVPSGEVRDPARTVPRAVGLGLLGVVAIYGGLQVAAQGVLGPRLATEEAAPLAALARALVGAPGGALVIAAATVSTLGYLASDALGGPRLLLGLAANGLLPGQLARIDPATGVPRPAVIAHAALCCALAIYGDLDHLMLATSVAVLALYVGVSLATLVLRARDVKLESAPFVVRGGPAVPVLSAAASLWLLAGAKWQEIAACAAVIAIVSGFYVAGRRVRSHAVR
jgi:amino acid transporter